MFCSDETVPINDVDQAEVFNLQNENNNVSWSCNPKQCLLDESILQNLLDVFKYLKSKSAIDVFNLISNQCPEFLNKIKILYNIKTHFPKIRTIVRELYQLKCYCKNINLIDCDLNSFNVNKLYELGVPFNIKNAHCEVNMHEREMNEDLIIEKYKGAYNSFKKRCNDLPIHHCISCHRLLCLSDLSAINKLRNPIHTDIWQRLQLFNETFHIEPSPFICHLYLKKIRANDLPSNSILNSLYYSDVPKQLSDLNNYEKMLIQRAKAFQVVTSLIPVGNKNIPNRQMIKKVKGRTFHLPLPTESTLNKLPKPEEPLNPNQELFILVRSCPTKTKIMWQDLVDIGNIYRALLYLKQNNFHYTNIILPENSDNLLDNIGQILNHKVEPNDNEKELQNQSAFLTQVTEDNEDIYEQYTIYPLHEKKQNSTACALYQMLKVNAAPIDNRNKDIDT